MRMIRLKERRKEKNITLDELSKLSGISKSYLSELENHKHDASVKVICSLCKALNVDPNSLIDETYWK